MRKLSLSQARESLPLPPTAKWPNGVYDIEMLRTGAASLSVFAPRGEDRQTPHDEDELYVIVSGTGCLTTTTEELLFEAGDAIYVPAGEVHLFKPPLEFVAWVVFFNTR